jgi:hypothetical protein
MKMMVRDETLLALGMLSMSASILIKTFFKLSYMNFSISDFLEGLFVGLSLVLNLTYLVRLKREKRQGIDIVPQCESDRKKAVPERGVLMYKRKMNTARYERYLELNTHLAESLIQIAPCMDHRSRDALPGLQEAHHDGVV